MGLKRPRGRRPAQSLRLVLNVWTALVLAFLMAPLLIVVPLSFSSSPYLRFPPPGWSLRWYAAYLQDQAWIDATLRSLMIGACAAVLATTIGSLLAYGLLRGRFPGRGVINRILLAPLIVPTIIYAISVYGLFAYFRWIGDWRAIVLAHTVQAIPFVFIVVAAGLRTCDENLELAAMGLGAGRLQSIWRVTLPQIRPALLSAMFLAFIASFDELVIAMFLGGSNMTLPKKMFDNILNEIDPTITAVSVLQVGLVTALLLAASRFGAGVVPRS